MKSFWPWALSVLALLLVLVLPQCLEAPSVPECGDVPFDVSLDECGSPCDIYCQLAIAQCPGTFENEAFCIDQCETEPVADQRDGAFDDVSGNTVGCRINALRAGDADACLNASFLDTEICIDTACNEYCDLMAQGPCAAAYANEADCLTTCGLIPNGAPEDGQNTIECRLRYARAAVENMDRNQCHSASRTGGNTCGTICESYCGFVMTNCTERTAIYGSREECELVCSFMDAEESSFDDFRSDEDSVDCRAYHASQPAADNPEFHCPHAQVYNSMQCARRRGGEPFDWICSPFCHAAAEVCGAFMGDDDRCESFCENLEAVRNSGSAMTVELFPQSTQECPTN
ncbi:MAG: hypothetical protein AAF627_17710 [Myxococcota bacterium]